MIVGGMSESYADRGSEYARVEQVNFLFVGHRECATQFHAAKHMLVAYAHAQQCQV